MWNWGKTCGSLVQYHMLQWEVAKVKQLMTSNMTLTVLNLHQNNNNSRIYIAQN